MTEKDLVSKLVQAIYHDAEVVVVDAKDRAFLVRATGSKEEWMVGVQKVKT